MGVVHERTFLAKPSALDVGVGLRQGSHLLSGHSTVDASTVKGFLDGLQGAYVVGWAVSHNVRNCEITVTDPHDNLLAKGVASVERPDLMGVANGRCDVAFRIPVPDFHAMDCLHVRADGVEISQSPLWLGPGLFDGHAVVFRNQIIGWVTERVANFSAPTITAVDQDGRVVMHCLSKQDDASEDGYFRPAQFSCELDDVCFGAGELRLTILANGTKFAQASCNLGLKGNLEIVSQDRCAGWLLAPTVPNRPLAFDVWRNGTFVARAKCNVPRHDVGNNYPGCSLSGFDVLLPPAAINLLDFTTLSLRMSGSDHELFDGPYTMGARPALVSAARNLSRLAVNSSAALLSAPERAILQTAIADFLSRARQADELVFPNQPASEPEQSATTRLNVVIPVYRDVAITRACIESVLDCRSEQFDRMIIINDCSAEPGMATMLSGYAGRANLFRIDNEQNLGFVKSINLGLALCGSGHILLLNSDTRVFPGGLDELWEVAQGSPDIGTVTALSNNATIFSYPHASLQQETLNDITWKELAAVALERNRGKAIDVPTGHGFCLLVKREVLDRLKQFDEIFGRGYGEENDLCCRAADLGYRNVAAAGVLVEHRESVSFAAEKPALLTINLPLLEGRYPEYTPIIMEVERRDDLRCGRWSLDAARLSRAVKAGSRFVLVVNHHLGGGTDRAITDIEATVGYGGACKISLSCREDGFMEIRAESPIIYGIFAQEEIAELLQVLSAAEVGLVLVHQVLGFRAEFLAAWQGWLRERNSIYYAHDFYPICPRVTMIDAVEQFCNLAPTDTCNRCLALGGAHGASRLTGMSAAQHRQAFREFLLAFRHVVAPSENTAGYYRAAFPDVLIEAVPHPGVMPTLPSMPREGIDDEVVLIGAIGSHKGSANLLALAHFARLTHPQLRFNVIGYTNRDDELRNVGNVTISGPYKQGELPELARRARGRLALFLSGWPETFSYTLAEAIALGFIPLVPNLGAPAERVRAAGLGVVFEFPIIPTRVLALISAISTGECSICSDKVNHAAVFPGTASIERTKQIFGLG